ncbi:MAG TPA: hypothetical protein VN903_28705 [Polyangia bacterium]|nr:hypothetical protein [Polyangia bacterium]
MSSQNQSDTVQLAFITTRDREKPMVGVSFENPMGGTSQDYLPGPIDDPDILAAVEALHVVVAAKHGLTRVPDPKLQNQMTP